MKSNDWRHKNVARYTPGNTKILYFFNCLLDGMHTKTDHICDFSRCRLNVRLCARIHPLLRGHKYSVLSVFGCWSKIRINVGEFGDSSEQVQVADEQLGRSETKHFYRLQGRRVRLFIFQTLQIRSYFAQVVSTVFPS